MCIKVVKKKKKKEKRREIVEQREKKIMDPLPKKTKRAAIAIYRKES